MKTIILLVCYQLLSFCNAEDINQRQVQIVRGVPTGNLNLYQPLRGSFSCFDGSKQIDFSQVNDDYCDCPDGSDEPGTSACSNSNFYCENVGHRGEYVLSSRVNDKICDCCDGSDEYNSGVSCPNICEEVGRADRVIRERKANIARAGYAKRVLLAEEGKRIRDEKLVGVEPLKVEKATLDAQVKELEVVKKAAEELENKLKDAHRNAWEAQRDEKKKLEAAELFKSLDKDEDGKVTIQEAVAVPYLDHNFDGQTTEEDVKQFFAEDSVDFEGFFTGWYDRLIEQKKIHEETKAASDQAKVLDHGNEAEEDDDELLAEEDKKHNQEEETMPPYPEEALKAEEASKEARKQYDEVFYKAEDLKNKISDAESFSSFDFGEDFAWAALKGQCFEVDVMQYTYKLCPFDRTSQKDKNGHGDVGLGGFKSWSGEGDKYARQSYGDGQQCWNGPKRSTQVQIECGEENAIVEVSEPAKCEYFFKFTTPAACENPDKQSHTEL